MTDLYSATVIISQHTHFGDLPEWVHDIFVKFITELLPPGTVYPILLSFQPFPTYFPDTQLSELMRKFGIEIKGTDSMPQIIDPRMIPNLVKNGFRPRAIFFPNGRIEYVVSPDLNPQLSCSNQPGEWESKVPWQLLEDKQVLYSTGNILIFTDPSYEGNYKYSIQYLVVPELYAIIVA